MEVVKKFLAAQDVLTVEDIETVVVDVPEWGGSIRLRALNGEEAIEFAESIKGDSKSASARIVVRCAVDENGLRIFKDADVDTLKKKSMKSLMRLQKVAMQINGLTEEETVKVKED